MRTFPLIAGLAVALLVLPEAIRTDVLLYELPGIDSYKTHRAFWGNHTVGQTVRWPHERIAAVGVWLGRYRREKEPAGDITLRIRPAPGATETLRTVSIPLREVHYRELTLFRFPPIAGSRERTLYLELQGPDATAQSALAVRIDPRSEAESTGMFFRNGKPEMGDMALQLLRRGGMWSKLTTLLARDQELRERVSWAALMGLTFVLLSQLLVRLPSLVQRQKLWEVGVMGLVLLAFLGLRLFLGRDMRAVPQGDPYNFAFIYRALLRGEDPYGKRLPGYPLLLLPLSVFTDDPLLAGRIANQVVIVSAAGALYALARRAGLGPPAALFGTAAFSVSRKVFFQGFQPLSYPLFTLQVLLALLLFPHARRHNGRALVLGVLLGWTAQTRHEGFVLAGLMGIGLLADSLRSWLKEHNFTRAFGPFTACAATLAVLLLPFFIHNLRTYGSLWYSEYIDAPVTNAHRSLSELREHAGQTWAVFSSLWWPQWSQEIQIGLDRRLGMSLAIGALLTGLGYTLRSSREQLRTVGSLISAIVGVVAIQFALLPGKDSVTAAHLVTRVLLLASFIGWVALLRRSPAQSGILLAGTLLAIPPFWFHPAAKNFVHIVPFVGLGIAAAADFILPTLKRGVFFQLPTALLVFLVSLPTAALFQGFPGMVERFNKKYVEDTLIRETATHLAALVPEGNVALQSLYLPVLAYFDGSRTRERLPGTTTPLHEWVRANNVRAILWRSTDTAFAEIADSPTSFPILFETRGNDQRGDERIVRLYDVPPQ